MNQSPLAETAGQQAPNQVTSLPAKLKKAYWQVVADCLVELYGVQPLEARRRVRDLRGRLEAPAADSSEPPAWPDLFYHQEPLYVAAELAGQEPHEAALDSRYQVILKRHAR
jgi:hypothetical protein